MTLAAPVQLKALILSLLAKSEGAGMPVQDLHSLLFAVGAVVYERPSSVLGLSFYSYTSGPFSPQLREMIQTIKSEGLIAEKKVAGQTYLQLTIVGRSFEGHYSRFLNYQAGAINWIQSHKDDLLRRANEVAEGTKDQRPGNAISFLKSNLSQLTTSSR